MRLLLIAIALFFLAACSSVTVVETPPPPTEEFIELDFNVIAVWAFCHANDDGSISKDFRDLIMILNKPNYSEEYIEYMTTSDAMCVDISLFQGGKHLYAINPKVVGSFICMLGCMDILLIKNDEGYFHTWKPCKELEGQPV